MWLLEFIGRGAAPAREQTRACVLLKSGEGPEGPAWPDERVADALELSVGGTKGIRRGFAERGLEGCVERKKPDREYERLLDGEQEARFMQTACSEVPDEQSQWSLRLLADRLVELEIVDSISHETVRQTLKKPIETQHARSTGCRRVGRLRTGARWVHHKRPLIAFLTPETEREIFGVRTICVSIWRLDLLRDQEEPRKGTELPFQHRRLPGQSHLKR